MKTRPQRTGLVGGVLSATLVAGGALLAGPAGAALWEGSGSSPANPALAAGSDITAATVAYDDVTGALTARITFRETPSGTAVVAGMVGTPAGADCGSPSAALGGIASPGTPAVWERLDTGGTQIANGTASRSDEGTTAIFTVTASELAGGQFRCAAVAIGANGVAMDQIANIPLTAAAAPNPPPVAPPVAPRKVARVELGAPKQVTLRRDRWTTLRVRVANRGTAPARSLRLSGSARGVQMQLVGAPRRRAAVRTVGTLRPGAARAVVVRARATAAARGVRPLTFILRGTGAGVTSARATTAGRVATPVRPRPKPRPKPKPTVPVGPPAGGPLAGTYHWGFKSHPDWAWDTRGVYFSNERWAYLGLPADGLPNCTGRTEVRDSKGNPTGDGCRPYSFNRATGALKVGDLSGSFRNGTVTLGDIRFSPLAIPRAGQRLNVNLRHRGFRGYCGFITGCTTWSETLVLSSNGDFLKGSSSVSSLGGSGTPYVIGGSYPADQRGTYQVLSNGRIRFAYADGSIKVETIGIGLDKAGRQAPQAEGVVVGDTNFYPERER